MKLEASGSSHERRNTTAWEPRLHAPQKSQLQDAGLGSDCRAGGWSTSMRLLGTTLPGAELEGHLLTIFLHDLPSPTVAQAGLHLLSVMLQASRGLFLPLVPTTYPVQTWPRKVKGQSSQP